MTAHVVVIYKASNVQCLYIRKDLKLNGCFYSRNRDEIHVRAVDNWEDAILHRRGNEGS